MPDTLRLDIVTAERQIYSHDVESVTAPGGAEAAERMSFTMVPVGLQMRLRNRL